MLDSIARKAVLIAAAVAIAPVLVIWLYSGSPVVRLASLFWAILLISVAWLVGRSLARRIHRLNEFAGCLLDRDAPRRRFETGDDEIGDLARSLSLVAPRIEELVKRLSNELARREAILASMSDAVLAVDAHLNVTFCNTAFKHAAGDRGVTEGVPLIKVIRDPDLLQMLKRVVETGEAIRRRLQLASTDVRSFEVHAVPSGTNSARGAIAILHDVTPSERLERVKRDFIANVSHEIRTPLATIRGYAETLLEGGLEDEHNRRKFVEVIQANTLRLNNIAADLLSLSELEAGQPTIQPTAISVKDVLSSAMRAVEPAANLVGVRIHAGPMRDLYTLGYAIRLEQAFVNLLDNAVKFNKPNGEVYVEFGDKGGDRVEIRVSDTGAGIPAEDLSRIFERFYRVDKARSRQVGGTGLGLSIVKHAIEQVGGTVAVESKLGKGSTFIVNLPQHCKETCGPHSLVIGK